MNVLKTLLAGLSISTPALAAETTVVDAAFEVSGVRRADVNDDGRTDITDAIHILSWRFLGGPEPLPYFGTTRAVVEIPECPPQPEPDRNRSESHAFMAVRFVTAAELCP